MITGQMPGICPASARRTLVCYLGKNLLTVVPHTGQVPFAIFRPFSVVTTLPFLTVRLVLHFTQYASNSILFPPFLNMIRFTRSPYPRYISGLSTD